jgi:type IV secretion system protein VirB3
MHPTHATQSAPSKPVAERIFKGCTRPAMVGGIPFVPFVITVGGHTLIAMWSFRLSAYIVVVALISLAISLVIMRLITMADDQRLMQWGIRLRLAMRQGNRKFWQATTYSPYPFRKSWQK